MDILYKFRDYPELKNIIKPNLKVKDIKKKVKEITGIKEKNQRFTISFDFQEQFMDENNFWDCFYFQVYDISNFTAKVSREKYLRKVNLDLNYNVGKLKSMIDQQTFIQEKRLQFFLGKYELDNEQSLKLKNLFENPLNIKISKLNNDILNIEYPNSEIKQIKTDLYNTGFELLEQIQNKQIKLSFDIEYNLIYNKIIIIPANILVDYGIKNGDTIKLLSRRKFTKA